MAFELEALVGHLYVVGGRTISTPPPGALVEVAPKKAARGREGDTFFCLVLPVNDEQPGGARPAPAPVVFYEEMAALAAERYFDTTGGVTAALREVISHLNENLYAHNATSAHRYEANLICAVLRGMELFVAKAGAGAAAIIVRDETMPFPAAFDNESAIYGTPMGVHPTVEPRMTRYPVNAGARFILADPMIVALRMDDIHDALRQPDIGATLVALRERLTQIVQTAGSPRLNVTLMAAECVVPEAVVDLPVRAAETSAILSTRNRGDEPAAPVSTDKPSASGTPARPADADSLPVRRDPAAETRYVAGAVASAASVAVGGVNKVLDRVVPLPKAGEPPRFGASTAVGMAVLIPLGVVLLVVVLWLTGTGESEFDQCVRRAGEAAALARGIDSSDVTGLIAAWSASIQVVDECERLRAGDPQMMNIRAEGRALIDTLMRIERREITTIETFQNALITRIILQSGDLYALDSRNQQVYRFTLATDGMSTVAGTRQPLSAMRRNGSINQYTVGEIIDIGWTDDGAGFSAGNVLVALDRGGLLIDCAPRFLGDCNAQRILGTETWVTPKAITFWQGRMYVLDPGANQLWRYDPLGGSFPNAPTEYFTGEGRPDIRNAVDVSIDDEGFVYILGAEGTIQRYRTGAAEPFGYANFPSGQPPANATAFFLNTNPVRQGIYIVDQPNRTIYEITLAGTFIASFRTQNEDMFAQLNDVAVDPGQEIIYAASGNGVLALRRLLGLPDAELPASAPGNPGA
ncbi:MAG: hypothetical protein SGI73_11070 [Chloroflexota bacterium]|nr:hypothetical protein [Chloroflexota bacterium]